MNAAQLDDIRPRQSRVLLFERGKVPERLLETRVGAVPHLDVEADAKCGRGARTDATGLRLS